MKRAHSIPSLLVYALLLSGHLRLCLVLQPSAALASLSPARQLSFFDIYTKREDPSDENRADTTARINQLLKLSDTFKNDPNYSVKVEVRFKGAIPPQPRSLLNGNSDLPDQSVQSPAQGSRVPKDASEASSGWQFSESEREGLATKGLMVSI